MPDIVDRESVLGSVLDNVDQGFALVNADLQLAVVNRRLIEMLGLDRETVGPGMSYEDFLWILAERGEFEGEVPEEAVAVRLANARIGKRRLYDRTRADGTILEIRTNPLPGGGFAVIYTDVTELRQREGQLRQSQKMEAIGQLASGVANDFNDALGFIADEVEALLDAPALDPKSKERLRKIRETAQSAGGLVRRLMAWSRNRTLMPQLTDVNELIDGTTDLLKRTLGAGFEVETALATKLWPVSIDRAHLETALISLAGNARDAMGPGGGERGRLSIETRNISFGQDYVERNPDATAGDHVLIAVSDTGHGMSAEILERAFEPFFTTKDAGVGLGLTTVYGFVKQSAGHIRIYSQPDQGTTVRLYLPRSREQTTETSAPGTDALPRGDERILVVEDEAAVRKIVVRQLESLGYRVSQAANGPDGLALLRNDGDYDLLLTDVVMPWPLSGKQVAEEVARRWPAMRVLFMSGYAENAILNHGLLEPGARLLGKPFRKADLARAIRRTLDDAEEPASS
jgi:signal transduction histidine kinase/CheY-like chemotaxis protein